MRLISTFTQLLNQSFPPAPSFAVDDIPDLSGKVMIVTGANAGIGKETAKVGTSRCSTSAALRWRCHFQALLAHNAKVYFACRNETKAREAIAELREATGNEGIFLPLDLADLRSVKAAAEYFMRRVITWRDFGWRSYPLSCTAKKRNYTCYLTAGKLDDFLGQWKALIYPVVWWRAQPSFWVLRVMIYNSE